MNYYEKYLTAFLIITAALLATFFYRAWTTTFPDYDGFVDYSTDYYTMKVPQYLEMQDMEISNKTLKYEEDFLNRTVFQKAGINDKYFKGENVFPIKTFLDINFISGTSPTFSLQKTKSISNKELERLAHSFSVNVFAEAMSASNNREIHTETIERMNVSRTYQGMKYFSTTYNIGGNYLRHIIIPLNNHMLNISYSFDVDSEEDMEKAINSLILDPEL